jgi:phosphoribosylanthranilate isomerase
MTEAATSRTRIKICGIRDIETAAEAITAGADAIGLVMVEGSPRYVTPARAGEIASILPPFVTSVGLVANLSKPKAIRALEQANVDWAQVHGDESPAFVESLGVPVIRGFEFSGAAVRTWDAVEAVEALLVDGSAQGGQGETFSWDGLASMLAEITKPIILAGGLTPENVGLAIETIQPWAVDVSSGVETGRGVKSPELIHEFCQAVRAADARVYASG